MSTKTPHMELNLGILGQRHPDDVVIYARGKFESFPLEGSSKGVKLYKKMVLFRGTQCQEYFSCSYKEREIYTK